MASPYVLFYITYFYKNVNTNYENSLQACLQPGLTRVFSQLRFPPCQWLNRLCHVDRKPASMGRGARFLVATTFLTMAFHPSSLLSVPLCFLSSFICAPRLTQSPGHCSHKHGYANISMLIDLELSVVVPGLYGDSCFRFWRTSMLRLIVATQVYSLYNFTTVSKLAWIDLELTL